MVHWGGVVYTAHLLLICALLETFKRENGTATSIEMCNFPLSLLFFWIIFRKIVRCLSAIQAVDLYVHNIFTQSSPSH